MGFTVIQLIVAALLLVQPYIGHAQDPGSGSYTCKAETCRDCIQKAGCAWCSQPDLPDSLTRCNSVSGNQSHHKCQEKYLNNPANEERRVRDLEISRGSQGRDTVQLQPQRISLKVRVGEPYNISLTYGQAKDYPIDLYYLMDLSNSMIDDKRTVHALGERLTEAMKNVTTDFRIGFGSFVDKVTMPFVSTSPKMLLSPCERCVPAFSFHHKLNLTSDTTRFGEEVEKAQISGNLDSPEGGFDALMQAIVCEQQIGWRQNARRLIIFSTDASFHSAGDGKLGGILDPNDGQCHLNSEGEYTHSALLDYPSVAQLNSKIRDKSVTIIFAVTGNQVNTYRDLSAAIQGSTSGELSSDSSNIVDLVKKEYEKITSEVSLRHTLMPNNEVVSIKYFSNCGQYQSGSSFVEGNKCSGLKVGQKVSFNAEIRIAQCPENRADWNQSFDIQVVGIAEKLTVDLELLCECDCEIPGSEGYDNNSARCNRGGATICGACVCDDQHYGNQCRCDKSSNAEIKEGSQEELQTCIQNNATGIVCSNRGQCNCGQCDCFNRQDPNEKIEGKHCECDNFSCRRETGRLCSGSNRGKCVCGKCNCNSGWSGEACECSTSREGCLEPGSTQICNGKGECRCNRCVCLTATVAEPYSGRYCEKCPSCPDKCSELAPCIQCTVHRTGKHTDTEACLAQCKTLPQIERVEVASSDETIGEKYCYHDDETDGCQFFYVYGYGSGNNTSLYIRAQETKGCPLIQPLVGVIGGVVLGTIIIGLILLCLIRFCLTMQEKREYARFEKDRDAARWNGGTNPLYKDPTSTFLNPSYGQRN